MRDYGKVQTEFWENPGVRRLTTEAKLLYLYLLTGPHTNMAGCFKAPAGYIADDLGWVSDTVSKAFAELSGEGFATFDEECRFVLVHGFLKFNQIANPKMAIGMMKWFREVPDTSPLKPMLAAEIVEYVGHLPSDLTEEAKRSSIPSAKQYPERYAKPENREQRTEKKEEGFAFHVERRAPSDGEAGRSLVVQAEHAKPKPRSREKPSPTPAEQASFDAFWAIYPRKVAKQPALEAYLAVIRRGVAPHEIASGASAYAGARAGKDPEKTAHATTWLNQGRWTDEIEQPPLGGYRDNGRAPGWNALDMAAEAIAWPENHQ